jgi:hypothetical protein
MAGVLTPGAHTITLTATDAAGGSATATVAISIRAELPPHPPSITVAPADLDIVVVEGETAVITRTLSIRNGGDGELAWSAADDQSWITLSDAAGIAPAEIVLSLAPAGLSVGEHIGTITITSPQAPDGTQTIPIRLRVQRDGWAAYVPIVLR